MNRDLAATLVKGLALLFAALVLAHWMSAGSQHIVNPGSDATISSPSEAERLLDRHEDTCWTASQAPLAELPGHAIVRWSGTGEVAYTGNHGLVDRAFLEALAAVGFDAPVDPKIDTVALCV